MGRGLCFHPMTMRCSIVIVRAGWRRSSNRVGNVLIGKPIRRPQVVDIFSHTYNWLRIFCRDKLYEMRTRLSANESVAYSTVNDVPIGLIACWSNEGNDLQFMTNKFDACCQSRITSQYHESLENILWIVSIERINLSTDSVSTIVPATRIEHKVCGPFSDWDANSFYWFIQTSESRSATLTA